MTAPAHDQWRTSDVLAQVQLMATLTRLSAGAGVAAVRLYSTPRPENLQTLPDAALAEIGLANSPGSVVDGVLVLQPAATSVMVLATGVPQWGVLVAADGAVLAEGGVTAAGGGGCFEVAGGVVAPGESAPTFYAGGLLTLAGTALT